MDLLKDDLGKLYRKFLIASFGSALIASIYGLVDMIVVGQYHGPDGAAAMSVIAPVWNIIYSFGLLTGIGGSVLYGVSKGKGSKKANLYFTSAVVFSAIISAVLWVIILVFEDRLLLLFGANEKLMPLCKEYMIAPKFTVPIYVCINLFSSFLRNDSDPGLATKSVIAGGVFNIFGDYFCVFTLDMGIRGAGIATAMCAGISTLVMLTHFFKKSNTLRLQFSKEIFRLFGRITVNGFSSFIIDVAMGVLTMLFNRQIMKYLGTDALAVYGVIVSVSTLVQCCSYGIGQASQPIISQNYGAGKSRRVLKSYLLTLCYSAVAAAVFGGLFLLFGHQFLSLFTSESDVIEAGLARIWVMCFSFPISATMDCTTAASRGLGKGLVPMIFVFLGSCVFRVIWVYTIFASVGTIASLYLLYPVSWTLTASAEMVYFFYLYRKVFRNPAKPATV